MDLRPLIHLWLNKPEVYGGKGYDIAEMKTSVFHGDVPNSGNGKSKKVWGNDYGMLDMWIDIDKAIGKLSDFQKEGLKIYTEAMLSIHGWNWEMWKMPFPSLIAPLTVIAYDILVEERGNDGD